MRKYMWFYRLYGELSHAIKSAYVECGIIHTGLREKRALHITYMKKTNARRRLGAHSVQALLNSQMYNFSI